MPAAAAKAKSLAKSHGGRKGWLAKHSSSRTCQCMDSRAGIKGVCHISNACQGCMIGHNWSCVSCDQSLHAVAA